MKYIKITAEALKMAVFREIPLLLKVVKAAYITSYEIKLQSLKDNHFIRYKATAAGSESFPSWKRLSAGFPAVSFMK